MTWPKAAFDFYTGVQKGAGEREGYVYLAVVLSFNQPATSAAA